MDVDGPSRVLLDKDSIRDVLFRYCHAVDRCNMELMKSCYHQDAYDDHGFFAGNAHAFCEYVIPQLKKLEHSVHSLSNILIDVDGDTALVESYWSVIHRIRRLFVFTDVWHQGRYIDLFEKRNGEWKIASRLNVVDSDRWMSGVNLGGVVPASHPNRSITGSRYPDDIFYLVMNDKTAPRRSVSAPGELWTVFKVLVSIPKSLINLMGAIRSRTETNRS